jgi:hypothetical protein
MDLLAARGKVELMISVTVQEIQPSQCDASVWTTICHPWSGHTGTCWQLRSQLLALSIAQSPLTHLAAYARTFVQQGCVVLEKANLGDLHSWLIDNHRYLHDTQFVAHFLEIVKGMQLSSCHSRRHLQCWLVYSLMLTRNVALQVLQPE